VSFLSRCIPRYFTSLVWVSCLEILTRVKSLQKNLCLMLFLLIAMRENNMLCRRTKYRSTKRKYSHFLSCGVSSYEISNICNIHRTTFFKRWSNLSFCKRKRHDTNVAEEYRWAIQLRRDGNATVDRVPVRRSRISTDSLLYTYTG